MNYALIGSPLGHSRSQAHFEHLFRTLGLTSHRYLLHETTHCQHLRQWAEQADIAGFNVTSPLKQAILPLLDRLDPAARDIGAVNCVSIDHGLWTGHNTDAPAFASSLQPLLPSLGGQPIALVLGSGGAAQAVAYALRTLHLAPHLVSRTPTAPIAIGYPEAHALAASRTAPLLLINATPVGMGALADRSPWPWPECLDSRTMVYDLIYNPSPTLLLRQAATRGATIKDGLEMLHRQADLSWQHWQRSH